MPELTKPNEIEDYKDILSSLIDEFITKDKTFRERRMREWKKLDLNWHGFFYFFWDSERNDFNFDIQDDGDVDFNRAANIYKAHGESIIANISSDFPHVVFFPEDADNDDDITSAKAKTALAKLIRKHNSLDLLLLQATYIMYNQDYVACWNRSVKDEKFGIYKTSTIVEEEEFDEEEEPSEEERDLEPIEETQTAQEAKTREVLEVFGPRNVEIPSYVKKMQHTPYLILRQDFSPEELRWEFPEFADMIEEYEDDSQEYWSRSPFNAYSETEQNTAVHEIIWLRPWALNGINEDNKNKAEKLLRMFPEGLRIDRVNDQIVRITTEDLDKHWTISRYPFADTIHSDPLGRPVVDMQEMTNDVLNFTVDTIGHGVGETFVDPQVLDADQYRDSFHRPGDVTGVKARPNERLDQSFYQNKPAHLSGEVDRFTTRLDSLTQLVSGSFPSIYGGELEGSRTASEYAQSGQRALQRLGPAYKVLKRFILEVMDRAVTNFAKNMAEKENFVVKQGDNFVNNWIFKSELIGNTGDVEIEGGEELPVSWHRIRELVFELMQNQNPLIQAIFSEPQNVALLKKVIGIPELALPGESSRNKQWAEIAQLIREEPIGGKSSIPTDFNLDDDAIELSICKYWINSEQGQFNRKNNKPGYENVVLHATEHQMNFMTKQQQAAAPQEGEEEDAGSPTN